MKNHLPKLWLLVACWLPFLANAQRTTVYTEAYEAYKQAEASFEKGLFGKAQTEYQTTLELLRPTNEMESQMLLTQAELGFAKSAVRLGQPEGEKLMLDFIREYSPDPISNQALIELANFYYNSKKYDKALEYFSLVPTRSLSDEQKSEVRFKMGYAYFVRKDFDKAKSNFSQIKNLENEYFYPTNYYYGLCEFFKGNYDAAITSFRIVEKSKRYKSHIPYYISQIYFAEGDYDDLIAYAEPKLNESKVRKRQELNQLVGQAYFEKGNFERALPYLEYYAERTGNLREEEFYQLGYTQYQVGAYKKAVKNLQELGDVNSELGQYAMYYSGDAYLKLNNRKAAHTAFGKARKLPYDAFITEESEMNYAKLSYELGYNREATNALQRIQPDSRYHTEAQTLMSEIFLHSREYKRALNIIEGIPNRTPQLREAYQKVAYFQGLQEYKGGNYDAAKAYFTKSNLEPVSLTIKGSCTYWLGDIAHRQKDYPESIRMLNQFLTLARTIKDLPEESSVYTANYTQGYNYLKQQDYNTALRYFSDAVSTIERNKPFIRNSFITQNVLGDATLRAGDCNFKRNRYNDAIRYYDQAVRNKYTGFVYALYQKAIIEGLRGNTAEKVLALEDIVEEYPDNQFADDALYSLGITYQEIGQLTTAMEPLRKLVTNYRNKSPLVVPSLLRLGLITYNQGNLQTSIEYYKQVFANNPEPQEGKEALSALEEIYVEDLSDPDSYTRFLETVPGYKLDNFAKDSLNFRAAESQYQVGNYERAIQGFTDYLRKFPNGQSRLLAFFHRGESYFQLKQYGLALEDFEEVVTKGQSRYYPSALNLAALISYNYTQDFAKSFDYYTKLQDVALDEDMRFEAQLGAMQSAYRVNNAQAVYDNAAKVSNNPNATAAQRATANFYLGKMAYDNKDFNSARNAFMEVIQYTDDEDAAEARYLIANIYYQQRNLAEAESWCNRAIQENGAYPDWVARSMILLSDTYADMGDLFNARAVLEALIENYTGDPQIVSEAQGKLNKLNDQAQKSSRIDSSTSDEIEFEDEGQN